MATPWFDPTYGIWYGSIAGSVCGTVGGTLGALAGTWAPQGKGRSLVLGGMSAFVGIGVINLIVGLIALVARQPYAIWYPLVSLGAILTLVVGGVLPGVRRTYATPGVRAVTYPTPLA